MSNDTQVQTTQTPTKEPSFFGSFAIRWDFLSYWFPKTLPFIVATALVLAPYFWIFGSWGFAKQSQEWANFATYYTGTISPVVTALGLYYIIQTFQLQQKQLSQVEEQARKSDKMLTDQLSAMQEQTRIAEKNMSEQLIEMEKQRSFGLVLSSLEAISNSINSKIEDAFNTYAVSFKNKDNQQMKAQNIQQFLLYFKETILALGENDRYTDLCNRNIAEIKEIFDEFNIFLSNVAKLNKLDSSEKLYLHNLILQGRLEQLKDISQNMIKDKKWIKEQFLKGEEYDSLQFPEEKTGLEFEAVIKTLNTFLTLTSTGEAESEPTTA